LILMLRWFIALKIVEMCVHMCCAGCEKKIRKAVERLEGTHCVYIQLLSKIDHY
jgi:copper chaperone CopZ